MQSYFHRTCYSTPSTSPHKTSFFKTRDISNPFSYTHASWYIICSEIPLCD